MFSERRRTITIYYIERKLHMHYGKEKKKPSARAIEKISEVTEEIADIWNGFSEDGVRNDVLGSYTGTPTDNTVHPVQDADDL